MAIQNHSRIGPSGSGRWVACPGSVQLQEQFPGDPNGPEAEEGNQVHDWSAEILRAKRDFSYPETTCPLNEEQQEASRVYLDDIVSILGARGLWAEQLLVEARLAIPDIHNDCYGYMDAGVFDIERKELIIWDLKYGWGIVDEWENWQGICYALGMHHLYRSYPVNPRNIIVRVVQPRPYCPRGRIRQWSCSTEELMGYAVKLREAAKEALSANPPLTTGPQCRNCTALLNCPAALQTSQLALDITTRFYALNLNPGEISRELDVLTAANEVIKHRLTVRREQAAAMIKQGGMIPGYAIENAPGRTVWICPPEHVITLGEMYGKDLRKPPVTATPAQARQAKIPWELIEPLTKTPTALKLVKDDGRKARKVFGGK